MKAIMLLLMFASFCAIADDFSRVSECNEILREATGGMATVTSQIVKGRDVYGTVHMLDGYQWRELMYRCADGKVRFRIDETTHVASAERV